MSKADSFEPEAPFMDEPHKRDEEISVRRVGELLEHREAQLQSIVDHAPALISTKDLKGIVTLCNKRFEVLDLPSSSDVVGRSVFELFPQDVAEMLWNNDLAARHGPIEAEESVSHRDGSLHTYLTVKFPIKRGDGQLIGTGAISTDITDRKNAERALQQERDFINAILNTCMNVILVVDRRGLLTHLNDAGEQLIGKPIAPLLGTDALSYFVSPDDHTKVRNLVREAYATDKLIHYEGALTDGEGNSRYFRWQSKSFRSSTDNRKFLVITGIDITTLKQTEVQLQRVAHYDALTALPNRLLLMERIQHGLQQSTRQRQQLAILFIDLDNFKSVNDLLGHAIGDQLLLAVSQAMLRQIRDNDTLGRLAGDEFIMLLHDIDASHAAAVVAEKLLDIFRKPFIINGHVLHVTASIGISHFPHDGNNVTDLIRHADMAMYQAKALGKNTYRFFASDMTEQQVPAQLPQSPPCAADLDRHGLR